MVSRKHVLESRLWALEHLVSEGVIPGQIDSIELQQTIGRIKELKLMIRILSAKSIEALVRELKNEYRNADIR